MNNVKIEFELSENATGEDLHEFLCLLIHEGSAGAEEWLAEHVINVTRVSALAGKRSLDADELDHVLSAVDLWLRVASIADADRLEKILAGQLNVMVIFETELRRRFPDAYKSWVKKTGGE